MNPEWTYGSVLWVGYLGKAWVGYVSLSSGLNQLVYVAFINVMRYGLNSLDLGLKCVWNHWQKAVLVRIEGKKLKWDCKQFHRNQIQVPRWSVLLISILRWYCLEPTRANKKSDMSRFIEGFSHVKLLPMRNMLLVFHTLSSLPRRLLVKIPVVILFISAASFLAGCFREARGVLLVPRSKSFK